MSNIFAKLLDEGQRQHAQLQDTLIKPAPPKQVVFDSPKNDSLTARQQPVTTARQSDSNTARQLDSTHTYVAAFLQNKATNKTTLRYPPTLMAELEEVLYQIKRTHGAALSKNEVFVLALAQALWDFKHNATRSLVFQELIQQRGK